MLKDICVTGEAGVSVDENVEGAGWCWMEVSMMRVETNFTRPLYQRMKARLGLPAFTDVLMI